MWGDLLGSHRSPGSITCSLLCLQWQEPLNHPSTTLLAWLGMWRLYIWTYIGLCLYSLFLWVWWRSWKGNTRLFSLSVWSRVVSCSSAQYSSTLRMSLFSLCFPWFRLEFRWVSPTLSASHIALWYSRARCLHFSIDCSAKVILWNDFGINLLWICFNAVHFNNISDGMHAVSSRVNGCVGNGSTLYCC